MLPSKKSGQESAAQLRRAGLRAKPARRGKAMAMPRFIELIQGGEDWLLRRVLDYAIQRNYARYTSTLAEAWRLSIAGLSGALLEACQASGQPPELGPDEDFSQDPIAAFGILEARRHRARGVSFGMFLGLMKYYRQSYLDLVRQAGFPKVYEEHCRLFLHRFFDRVEIGFSTAWAGLSAKARQAELQAANRAMANEKSLYLTIFGSLPTPALLLNADNRISHLNHAAMELLRGFDLPANVDDDLEAAPPLATIPFLADDLQAFLAAREPERLIEKSIATRDGIGFFQIKLQRLLDVSRKFQGTVVLLEDLTAPQWAAQALRKSEERYRLLFHSSNDAVFVHPPVTGDTPARFIEVNAQACQSLGYTREELLQLSPLELGEAGTESEFIAIREKLAAEKQVLFETVHVAKDGRRIPVEINTRLFHDHGRPLMLSMVRDISKRKQAEMEVRRLASFPELNPNPVVEVDAAGAITYANPATRQAAIPSPAALLPPDVMELMEAAGAGGARQCYREVWVKDVLYGVDISFPEQLPVARLYAADITARHQMETQLELKSRLLDNATDFIHLAELDGTLRYCNESMAGQLGYGREELLGQKIPALLTQENARRFSDRVENLQAQGEAVFDSAYHRKDGTVLPVEVRARLLTLEGRPVILGVSRDISERQAAAAALLDAAHKWRTTFDAIGDAVFLMDRDSRIIQANRALADLVQKPFGEIVGRPCWEVVHNATGPIADCPLVRMWENPRRESLVFPSGKRWLKAAVDPIFDDAGAVTGAVHIITDISDSVRAHLDLRSSLEKLRRTLNGTVSALSSMVETRDPYTAGHQRRVALLAATLALEMGLTPDQAEGMRVIGFLHDIGKIAVPAEVLSRPGKISPLEFNLIQCHSQAAYDILKTIDFPWPVAQAVHQHHERLDGSGYPLGLHDEDIILEAKILMVADVVEAMASHRPYRPARGIDVALEEITGNQGKLYDPEVVAACVKLFRHSGFTFN